MNSHLDVVDDEVDGDLVLATPGHDDVGVDHGRGDEDVESRLHVTVVLLQNALKVFFCKYLSVVLGYEYTTPEKTMTTTAEIMSSLLQGWDMNSRHLPARVSNRAMLSNE